MTDDMKAMFGLCLRNKNKLTEIERYWLEVFSTKKSLTEQQVSTLTDITRRVTDSLSVLPNHLQECLRK
jgi:hypothetical protein